jgi:mandelate racemase
MAQHSSSVALTIGGIEVRGVRVPLNFALGTSAATIATVPIVLLDVRTAEGVTGRSYVFCYSNSGAKAVAGHLAEAVDLLMGQAIHPQSLAETINRRYALLGVTGTVRIALSALDAALWDAVGQAAGLPLVELLGGQRRPIPAYDSRGLGLKAPKDLAREAEALRASGLKALKVRIGYPSLEGDLTAIRTVRRAIGDDAPLMVDYNQALVPTEALRRGYALQDEGIVWLEEPIRHDDYRGCARIARELRVPVQIGENFNGPEAMQDAVAMEACDLVMPDVARIGGVSGWMRAAGIAAANGLLVSSHLMPELSVHLLAATPTAHWLEYVDWADAFLDDPMVISDGAVTPPERPGFGISWSKDKLRHLESI